MSVFVARWQSRNRRSDCCYHSPFWGSRPVRHLSWFAAVRRRAHRGVGVRRRGSRREIHGGGEAGHGGAHDPDQAPAWISLFGLRFWSFGAAFFGITGLVLRAIGLSTLAPLVSTGVGIAAGLAASATFRRLTGETVGQVRDAAALVGREGKLLLPVARGQRGKVRLAQPGGGDVDSLAESDEALASGTEVLIVEVRGNVAVVARAPAERPAPRA